MVAKITYSEYVKSNFYAELSVLAKDKKKSRSVYHPSYVSVDAYLSRFSEDLLHKICHKISIKEYKCEPLTPIILPKSNCSGKSSLTTDNTRLVCVPSVQDKVLQKVFINYLKTHYKASYHKFCKFDHALNKGISDKKIDIVGKGGKIQDKVVSGIRKSLYESIELRNTYDYVLKADIVKFFDNINREIAFFKFNKEFLGQNKNDEILYIFKKFLYCDAKLDFGDKKYKNLLESHLNKLKGKGVRQGMPLASLCASMYLYEFDEVVTGKGIPYIRYADDFLLFSNTYQKSKEIQEFVKLELENIGLAIEKDSGEQKTKIYGLNQVFTYLGFEIVYSEKYQTFVRRIPTEVFERAISRIEYYDSLTKVKREFSTYINFSVMLDNLISGYTNYYSEENADNGNAFKLRLHKASKEVRKKLIKASLGIDFDQIESKNKQFFFFGIKD
ncbi:reverse transcriptase domain-containing protein [Psychrobacter alimentarius]|uniref:reverse transcriptase domain-containing protein n=1 Tax=Psychrobacter alimentarius TaxID=261164 RepID=UPI003FD114E7